MATKQPLTETIKARVSAETRDQLREHAASEQRSEGEIVRFAIVHYLAHQARLKKGRGRV